ncbi:uncharacterized protein LOC108744090 [Agrilus planipennis]|uniref:Uncharacterized protein LOC108744090 n=1 Tax=Agrilus planipennis TaxID=224129 RepID=A0A1W4XRZ3_AGRPL|nr:uncharacterized protein LOC108744090 [Agrilus planipennis]
MLLTKVLFIFSAVSTCSCWYYYHYYYNPYDKYFREPYSYFRRQNSNCERWCYSYTTPHIHCCVYKERPNTCPYAIVYCSVPLAPEFTAHFQCNGDFDCPVGYKCCDDSCFSHKICKSHNIEWLRWNTYSHTYNHYLPSTTPPLSYSPKQTEDESEVFNITVTSPIPSTLITETSSEELTKVNEVTYTTSYTTSDSPQLESVTDEIANIVAAENLTTSVSSQFENVTTPEEVLDTNTGETLTTSDSSQMENKISTTEVFDEETSTVSSTSTTQNTLGVLFYLFGKKEAKTNEPDKTEEPAENSVDIKETEVNGVNNETNSSKRPIYESSEDGPVIEGSGTELEGKETESMNKEGSGNSDDKESIITFIDDEDIERKRRSNIGNRNKNKEGKKKISLDINGDDNNDTENNDLLFFDSM